MAWNSILVKASLELLFFLLPRGIMDLVFVAFISTEATLSVCLTSPVCLSKWNGQLPESCTVHCCAPRACPMQDTDAGEYLFNAYQTLQWTMLPSLGPNVSPDPEDHTEDTADLFSHGHRDRG